MDIVRSSAPRPLVDNVMDFFGEVRIFFHLEKTTARSLTIPSRLILNNFAIFSLTLSPLESLACLGAVVLQRTRHALNTRIHTKAFVA